MIIKVCGIKYKENIEFLRSSNIDMVGLNFYKPSVRYIDSSIPPSIFDSFPDRIQRVGVFVNEEKETLLDLASTFKLDYAQLHGDEDAEYCNAIAVHLPIIKVFRIEEEFDFEQLTDYMSASYFLFDTQTKHFGGSGRKFDWRILKQYHHPKPFILSGGIGPSDVQQLQEINHPSFAGVDINSKFESSPGLKDHILLSDFISQFNGTKITPKDIKL